MNKEIIAAVLIIVAAFAFVGLTGNITGSAVSHPGCSETDDGKDYYEEGTATSGDIVETDVCLNDYENLLEYWCYKPWYTRNWKITLTKYKCPYGCLMGECSQDPNLSICDDSEPIGVADPYVKGTIFICHPNTLTCSNPIFDTCFTNSSGTYVADHYCVTFTPSDLDHKIFKCTNGCTNGACIK